MKINFDPQNSNEGIMTFKYLTNGVLLITLIHPEAMNLQKGIFLKHPDFTKVDVGSVKYLCVDNVLENRKAKGVWKIEHPFWAKIEASYKEILENVPTA